MKLEGVVQPPSAVLDTVSRSVVISGFVLAAWGGTFWGSGGEHLAFYCVEAGVPLPGQDRERGIGGGGAEHERLGVFVRSEKWADWRNPNGACSS